MKMFSSWRSECRIVTTALFLAILLSAITAAFAADAGMQAASTSAPGVVVHKVKGSDAPPAQVNLSSDLPALPQAAKGQFAGNSNGALIVAGGQSASGQLLDTVYVLPKSDKPGAWVTAKLDKPLAFGSSVIAKESLICVGGLTDKGATDQVLKLSWKEGKLTQELLPPLPAPRAFSGAGVVGETLYVMGGVATPDAAKAEKTLFALDLSPAAAPWRNPFAIVPKDAVAAEKWRALEDFPGTPRIFPAVAGHYGALHVFGGREIAAAGGDKQYKALSDAWQYRPKRIDGRQEIGWCPLKNIPRPLADATAVPQGQAHIILVSGNSRLVTGSPAAARQESSGADAGILTYHAVTDSWAHFGDWTDKSLQRLAASYNGNVVFAGGTDLKGAPLTSLTTMKVIRNVKQLHWIDFGVIFIYFAVMAGIGLYFSSKQTSSEEFALGGRNVHWLVSGLALFATGCSAFSFMAIPAQTYSTNLVWLFGTFLIPFTILPSAYIIIPLIRRLNLTSTYEYLERRFHPSLRLLASFQNISFLTFGRMSVVMLLPALAINAVTGLDIFMSIIIMGILTTFYTFLGGVEAVMWTDVIQAILKLCTPLILFAVIVLHLEGGMGQVIQTDVEYSKFTLFILSGDFTQPVIWITLIGAVFGIIGFAGDQAMVQRVLCTPSVKEARKATITMAVLGIISSLIFQGLGIAMFAYFHHNPGKLDPTMKNDQIVPLLIVQSLPIGLAGLLVAGIFAAAMSVLSGTMHSVGTLVSEDFYKRFSPSSSDQSRLWVMRFTTFGVGAIGTSIALVMASTDIKSMFMIWNNICALLGGGFVGIYTLGMFTKRANAIGSFAGAIASVVETIYVQNYTPLHWSIYTPLAIITCIVVGYLVSLATPTGTKDLTGLTIFTLVNTAEQRRIDDGGAAPEQEPAPAPDTEAEPV